MIVLDTNVLSTLMQKAPDTRVIAWLDQQPRTSIWITSVTLFEIHFGLQVLSLGKRRSLLTQLFETVITDKIGQRIAPFDSVAALQAGNIMAARQKRGRPVDLRDTMIAGIVLARRATLATRNTLHFEDLAVRIVNPWE